MTFLPVMHSAAAELHTHLVDIAEGGSQELVDRLIRAPLGLLGGQAAPDSSHVSRADLGLPGCKRCIHRYGLLTCWGRFLAIRKLDLTFSTRLHSLYRCHRKNDLQSPIGIQKGAHGHGVVMGHCSLCRQCHYLAAELYADTFYCSGRDISIV